jgi:hypothetical protein
MPQTSSCAFGDRFNIVFGEADPPQPPGTKIDIFHLPEGADAELLQMCRGKIDNHCRNRS